MQIQHAVMAFSQSEKIKSGLVWASQIIELVHGLPVSERPGSEKMVRTLINMIAQEIRLAKNVTSDEAWDEVEKHMDQAMVMINSGVTADSVLHLTRALSHVTSVGHRSMSFLKDHGIL